MANPFSKGWKYLMRSFDSKIDENADPRVQIQQAVAAAKQNHQEITQQAAAIIGNRNQLQMKLDRLIKSQEDLQAKARTALGAADKAAAAGDAEKAQQFNSTAEVIATQLVSVEQELEQVKQAYASADQAASEAQAKQQQSEARLKEQLSQVSQLESQLNQAKMQEQTAATMDSMNAITANDNVPTLDGVRDKIERRYANALGAQELAENSMGDRMAEIEASATDMAAASRLEQIRASMNGGNELEAGTAGELEAGETAEDAEPEKVETPTSGSAASVDDILADAAAYMDADDARDADDAGDGKRD